MTKFSCLIAGVLGGAILVTAAEVRADGLRFYLEHNYTQGTHQTTTADGIDKTEVQAYAQSYRLDFDRRLFPYLVLRGGGIFDRDDATLANGGEETDSTVTESNPYLDLSLNTPLFSAALGYNKRQNRSDSNNASALTLIREVRSAAFSWHPAELPSLSLNYTEAETFDRERRQQDDFSRRFLLGSDYAPGNALAFAYQGNLTQTENRVDGLQTEEQGHSGRITFNRRFWQNRTTVNGSYQLSYRQLTTESAGAGEISTPVPAITAVAALDETPEEGELPAVTALGDGNLTVASGIDLGSAAGDSALRNLGLDLFEPQSEVSTVYVYVDKELPHTVAAAFVWDIYASDNGLEWHSVQRVAAASFAPFLNRFEVRFAVVRSRYLKVVVAPLSPAVLGGTDYPQIAVTELQAVLTRPASEVTGKTSTLAQQFSLAAKTRLLDNPGLYYDFSLLYATSDAAAGSRISLSNGLSLQHTFSPSLNGTAQVGRDDTHDPAGNRVTYRYGGSLTARPLRPLSHTLAYSGRIEAGDGRGSQRNSIFLNNRATLYRGIDVLLNGGQSFNSYDDGEESQSTLLNFGAVVTPHRSMTWNLNVAADRTEYSGGLRPDGASSSRRARLSVALNPLPALSLYAALEAVEQEEKMRTLHNYAVNWSPFRDGALQFSVAFNESLRPREDAIERLLAPSLRWEVRPGTFLELSYSLVDSESPLRTTESRFFNALLRASF